MQVLSNSQICEKNSFESYKMLYNKKKLFSSASNTKIRITVKQNAMDRYYKKKFNLTKRNPFFVILFYFRTLRRFLVCIPPHQCVSCNFVPPTDFLFLNLKIQKKNRFLLFSSNFLLLCVCPKIFSYKYCHQRPLHISVSIHTQRYTIVFVCVPSQ